MKYPRRQAIKGIGGTLALTLLSKSAHALQEDRTARPRIRIGQIGVGHAHANKLSVYRKSPDYEVFGIVEPNAELRQQAEAQEPFRDLPWMTQEELLNVSGLQAVLVETHVRDLLNVAETCVAAGKHVHVDKPEDTLVDNMLAVFEYPHATATVKSSAVEVDGGERRHLVVCGTEGSFHIQPLDNPSARVALSAARDTYVKGYQDITFPKYVRYVDDATDMAKIIRGEKESDFSPDHDLAVQTSLLKACGL